MYSPAPYVTLTSGRLIDNESEIEIDRRDIGRSKSIDLKITHRVKYDFSTFLLSPLVPNTIYDRCSIIGNLKSISFLILIFPLSIYKPLFKKYSKFYFFLLESFLKLLSSPS